MGHFERLDTGELSMANNTIEYCVCGSGNVAIVSPDDNHLWCNECRAAKKRHGWCAAEAALNRKWYGNDWTVAQASQYRQRIEQPQRKHSRGWRW